MARIFPGRYTARTDKPFVVFLIGMRINQLWAVHKWMPVAAAMPPMLKTLAQHPAKGLLGVESWVRWREVMTIQYWRSFEDLEQFARNPTDPHLQAWKDFNQRVGSDGSVGIWHETFLVEAGQYRVCVRQHAKLWPGRCDRARSRRRQSRDGALAAGWPQRAGRAVASDARPVLISPCEISSSYR